MIYRYGLSILANGSEPGHLIEIKSQRAIDPRLLRLAGLVMDAGVSNATYRREHAMALAGVRAVCEGHSLVEERWLTEVLASEPTAEERGATLAGIGGLGFGDCVTRFKAAEDDPHVAAAREHYHRDGEVEIDESTVLSDSRSVGGNGEYVMAWVWVYNSWAGLPDSDADIEDSDEPQATD